MERAFERCWLARRGAGSSGSTLTSSRSGRPASIRRSTPWPWAAVTTPNQEERDQARLLWPRAGSLARMRDDLAVMACGPFVERPEAIPDERLFSLPAPEPAGLADRDAPATGGARDRRAPRHGGPGRHGRRWAGRRCGRAAGLARRAPRAIASRASRSARPPAAAPWPTQTARSGHAVLSAAGLLPRVDPRRTTRSPMPSSTGRARPATPRPGSTGCASWRWRPGRRSMRTGPPAHGRPASRARAAAGGLADRSRGSRRPRRR